MNGPMVKIVNPVHNTSVTIRVPWEGYSWEISQSTFERLGRELCGIKKCTCLTSPASGMAYSLFCAIHRHPYKNNRWVINLTDDEDFRILVERVRLERRKGLS